MEEFTDVVIQDAEGMGTGFERLIRSIQSQVSKYGLRPDIEAVLTVLQGKTKPIRTLEDIAFSGIQYPEEFKGVTAEQVDAIVRFEIEDSIYKRCMKVDRSLAVHLYGELWDAITNQLSFPMKPEGQQFIGGTALQRIFTTNYDLSIDSFLKRRHIGFNDGFRFDDVGDAVFSQNWEEGTNFYKLHGSINYYFREDGRIVRSDALLEDADIYGRELQGRMMIYPTGEKYATRFPYYEYLGQLRQALASERVCIVIGYSFRDTPINNAFLDGIQKNPALRILIVGPSASRIRDDLPSDLKRNTLALNGPFGDSLSPQAIVQEFKQWPSTWPLTERPKEL